MSAPGRAARGLQLAAAVLAAGHVALMVGVALFRLGHPYELEWLEGGSLDHVRRLVEGRALYGPPSLEFTPFMYTPLYYYVSAAASAALGLGLPALRLVSLLASLATLALLFDLVRRETGRWAAGLLAAGLYAATYRLSGAWFDVARVDALFVALLMGSLYLLRIGRGVATAVLAGAVLALAVQTKQVGVLAALPFAAAAWPSTLPASRRRAVWFGVSFVLLAGATALALDRASGGWYRYYVFTLGRQHGLESYGLAAFLARDLLARLFLALALVLMAARLAGPHRAALRFHAVAGAGLLAIAVLSRMNVGGYHNVAMPAHALLAILFGLSVAGLRASGVAAGVALAQLLLLAYDPRPLVPRAADRLAGDRLVEALRARPGPILVPSHPYLLPMAGHPGHAHQMAMNDVLLNEGREALRQRLASPMRESLRERRFQVIVLDAWFWFRPEVESCYREEGPAFADPGVFWPRTGAPTRPETVYVPGEDGPCRDLPPEALTRPPPGAYRPRRPPS